MPFVLPRSITSDKVAFILAYGNLSNLELCSLNKGGVSSVDSISERVTVVSTRDPWSSWVPQAAGVHKAVPVTDVERGTFRPVVLMKNITEHFDRIPTLSVSTYGLEEDESDYVVRAILDEFRGAGFRKTRLLRPKGDELRAEEVLSRSALDVVVFHHQGGYGIGPTAWVSDPAPFRERGVAKPQRHSEISLSPRLASLLVNLANLSPGQTALDPFCGSGTILAEALMRSCRCLGLDSNEVMVRHARRNLSWIARSAKGGTYEVGVGDARELPHTIGESKIDAVVTEPLLIPSLNARPNMKTATDLIERAGGVYANALASIAEVISPGGRIVMVVPVLLTQEGREISLVLDGKSLGLKQYQPGPVRFDYPVRPSFENTRWVRRGIYVFET
jgi:tRNA G10  N-methylase Trm11